MPSRRGAQHLAVVRAHGDRAGANPGYGKKEDFKPIFDQVKSIEQSRLVAKAAMDGSTS